MSEHTSPCPAPISTTGGSPAVPALSVSNRRPAVTHVGRIELPGGVRPERTLRCNFHFSFCLSFHNRETLSSTDPMTPTTTTTPQPHQSTAFTYRDLSVSTHYLLDEPSSAKDRADVVKNDHDEGDESVPDFFSPPNLLLPLDALDKHTTDYSRRFCCAEQASNQAEL